MWSPIIVFSHSQKVFFVLIQNKKTLYIESNDIPSVFQQISCLLSNTFNKKQKVLCGNLWFSYNLQQLNGCHWNSKSVDSSLFCCHLFWDRTWRNWYYSSITKYSRSKKNFLCNVAYVNNMTTNIRSTNIAVHDAFMLLYILIFYHWKTVLKKIHFSFVKQLGLLSHD